MLQSASHQKSALDTYSLDTTNSLVGSGCDYQVTPATIRISNLRLRTFIGFNQEELEKQQDIIINAEIRYRASAASKTDDEHYAMNYKSVCKSMIKQVENGRFRLLEKLVADLLDTAMSESQVEFARVTVDKPHALRFADSVSVSLSAKRNQAA